MANKSQNIRSENEGVIIQSAGDTNINAGLSTGQMREIVECLADQMPKYVKVAGEIVDQRLAVFKNEIIERFERDENADREAFADPDFQYLLGEAQKSFARSGEQKTIEILSDLLIERSKVSAKTRKRLSLAKALSVVGDLTEQEIAEVVLAFVIRFVRFLDVKSPMHLAQILKRYTSPFIDNISADRNSYIYLESIGCGKLSMGEVSLFNCLHQHYPDALLEHEKVDDIANMIGSENFVKLLTSKIFEVVPGYVRRNIHNFEEYRQCVSQSNIAMSDPQLKELFEKTQPKNIDQKRFCQITEHIYPDVVKLFNLWDQSPMKNLEISAVGVAIGFVTLKRVAGFDGDIDIWLN